MKIENIYSFSKKPQNHYGRTAFTCFIGKDITTKEALLHKLALSLDFPGYFGMNWDALNDCLFNFNLDKTIKERVIIISHDALMLDSETLEKYVGTLMHSTMFWRKNKNEHIIIPIFHIVDKQTVMDTLYNNEMGFFNLFNKEFFPEG
jgi:RNAse (barnase) inhibitor barstar